MAYGIKSKRARYANAPFSYPSYLRIGSSEGLEGKELHRYADFMVRRFPNERHESYAREWAVRFKKGSPQDYMDSESKAAYEQTKKEYA